MGGALSAPTSHKQQGALCTFSTPALWPLKSNALLWKTGVGEEGGSSRARLKEAGHNWVGAAEACLQPGRIGLWGSEPGRIRGEGPTCWDVRASCFFLPAVGYRGGALPGDERPWSWSALAGAGLGSWLQVQRKLGAQRKWALVTALFCLAQEL